MADTLKKYNREYRWALRRQKLRNLKHSYRAWGMEHPVKAFFVKLAEYTVLWVVFILAVIYL